ncbi:chitobiosyldiphosphodolichol beta-mannosyltransferase-like isoform X2 [Girardinichthys multiradiatus]|uniref:chitobiosyldiphosphodolichol beta-mannosyltransferase-like isoform X2 n=1 Tax=Girardinichthys multiradiatus TaxID=208333 RepID=UPI001FAD8C45|nr:chitobiosyldiphosphodolichol beta-mannosyltransferase-like isoform X2 [Girardinichthys multiradiatus]XP_047214909.1 chitobiosyldiphosphodolichol beta-mannosyltransferase-like isoform X2 [Girardinichthys multiradiatus]
MATRGSTVALLAVLAVVFAGLPSYFVTDSGLTCPGVCLAVVAGILLTCLRRLRQRDGGSDRRVCVLVLGDIGRSPRMQYHALSLSKHGYQVTFVGFLDSKPHQDVLSEEKIRIVAISEVKGVQAGPKLLTYVTKTIVQSAQILHVLLSMELQAHILMQNPPGLPGVAVAWVVCVLRGSTFIIDWHNYGYTIMALSLGASHPVVRLAKWYEHLFGPLASHSLCVTNAMKGDLLKNWGIKATTLYDRPASIFRETPLDLQHELFVRLAESHPQFRATGSDLKEMEAETTVFTVRNLGNGDVTLRLDRPALLISSTSWTEDEDFSILLKALEEYEDFIRGGASLPSLVCVITGKGPQKEHYKKLISSLNLEHVKICTPWLEAEDYPLLLGSADLGVCLHKSSSGLDLPMKVVDMFGCCLPVCAIQFDW